MFVYLKHSNFSFIQKHTFSGCRILGCLFFFFFYSLSTLITSSILSHHPVSMASDKKPRGKVFTPAVSSFSPKALLSDLLLFVYGVSFCRLFYIYPPCFENTIICWQCSFHLLRICPEVTVLDYR